MPHAQFKEYLERAEFVKGILDGQIPAETTTANGSVGQKARPPGEGDKDVRPLCMCYSWLPHRRPACTAWLARDGCMCPSAAG